MRKYLFFLFGLLVMFSPLESHAQNYELSFACFYDGYWGGTGIMLNIIRLGVTMEVLWSMIVMTILHNIVLNFR